MADRGFIERLEGKSMVGNKQKELIMYLEAWYRK